jgi:hypothetical protein
VEDIVAQPLGQCPTRAIHIMLSVILLCTNRRPTAASPVPGSPITISSSPSSLDTDQATPSLVVAQEHKCIVCMEGPTRAESDVMPMGWGSDQYECVA